ncbi:MAG TPA: hypothetical protein VMU61_09175 [Candidatus Aquilonibacter sp.]|nr:hypothetical protein [Candidatus Aquilonibacter sp.]
MVGIDETTLSLVLHPKARPPKDPKTKKLVERVEDRIEKLLEDLDADSERIILPTPALCEFLTLAGKDGPEYLEKIKGMKTFLVKPFDEMAAIELAAIEHEARGRGNKRGGIAAPWTKVRFDRQIVAIAKVNGCKKLYSDDGDVIKFGEKAGLEVVSTWSLPLPLAKQIRMDYDAEPIRAISFEDEADEQKGQDAARVNQNPTGLQTDSAGSTGNAAAATEEKGKEKAR